MEPELTLKRESPGNPDIAALLSEREVYLGALYPNRVGLRRGIERDANVLGLFGLRRGGELVGCGSLIRHPDFLEVKKVFLAARVRGTGLGRYLMAGLEAEAEAAGFALLRLEVGRRQAAALRFYRRLGFSDTVAFPPYREDPISCFLERRLVASVT